MNRGDLKARVAGYAKGGAAGARLPLDTIFDNAQKRIIRTVHPIDLDVFVSLPINDDNGDPIPAAIFRGQVYSHTLPADLLDPFYVVNNDTRLRSKRADKLVHDYSVGVRGIEGENKPWFYAFSGPRTLLTAPGPGGDLRVGYKSADALTPSDQGENVVMKNAEDVYFWGMMMGVEAFYRDPEGYQVARSEFNAVVMEINQVADAARYGAGGTAANW